MSWRLYLDLGNTALKYGARQSGEWLCTGSIPLFSAQEDLDTDLDDEVIVDSHLLAALQDRELYPDQCESVALCCSVQESDVWLERLIHLFRCPWKVLGEELEADIPVGYRDPREMGQDRIANSVAAVALYGAPVIVLDSGSCLTMEVVSAEGVLLGGVIAAGRAALLEAVAAVAPQLEDAIEDMEMPTGDSAIGRSTGECLALGNILQFLGGAAAMVLAVRGQVGADTPVVVTGGDWDLLQDLEIDNLHVERLLTLEGLRLIDGYD